MPDDADSIFTIAFEDGVWIKVAAKNLSTARAMAIRERLMAGADRREQFAIVDRLCMQNAGAAGEDGAKDGVASVPRGTITVDRNDLQTLLDQNREAGHIAMAYTPSIDSIEEHGGAESEDHVEQIAYHLYYGMHAAMRLRKTLENAVSSGGKVASDVEQTKAGQESGMIKTHAHGARVVAWRYVDPSCSAPFPWVDGLPEPLCNEYAARKGYEIELAYGEPPAAPSALPPQLELMSLTEDGIRAEWRNAGGSIHGPNVETVTMPESAYFAFRRYLAAGAPAASPQVEPNDGMIDVFLEAADRYHHCNGGDVSTIGHWRAQVFAGLKAVLKSLPAAAPAASPQARLADEPDAVPAPTEHEIAWGKVVDTLTEVAPWWSADKGIPMEQACLAIRRLAKLSTVKVSSVVAPFPVKPLVAIDDNGRIAVYIGTAYQFMDLEAARSLRDQLSAIDQEKLA